MHGVGEHFTDKPHGSSGPLPEGRAGVLCRSGWVCLVTNSPGAGWPLLYMRVASEDTASIL